MASNLTLHKEDYFPHQWDFLTKKKANGKDYPMRLLCGGMGSGKTHSFLHMAFIQHISNKNKDGISNGWVIYPTYALAEEVFIPPFLDILRNKGIAFDYNVAKHTIDTAYGHIKIFQMVKPQSIIGVSLSWAGFDEFDVCSYNYCKVAWQKAIGRMRDCDNPVMFVTTTPEGYKYAHHEFVEKKTDEKLLVFGKTTDNVYLPPSYLKLLEDNYDKNLLKAYRDGNFVNIQQGSTYNFNRDTCVSEVNYDRYKPIYIGVDFNCDPMVSCLIQLHERQPQIRVFDCISLSHGGSGDLLTERMCQTIKSKYPNSEYIAYPDATGVKKGTSAMFSDIDLIYKAGFKVRAGKTNPRVVDRVNAVNKQLEGNIVIDPKAKTLIEDFEKVVNKEGTREIDKSNSLYSHASDAFGYFCAYEFPIIKPTLGSIRRI